jgi:integrase
VDLSSGALNVGSTLQVINSEFVMREPKSAAGRRRIPLTQECVEALKEQSAAQADYIASHDEYQHKDLVVCRPDGGPWHPDAFSAERSKTRDALGLSLRFHDLRHTHASLLLSSGAHPKALQERLGHSTAAFTMNVYAHLLPGVQEEAVANLEAMLQKVDSQEEEAEG